jgi:hypothetical protein
MVIGDDGKAACTTDMETGAENETGTGEVRGGDISLFAGECKATGEEGIETGIAEADEVACHDRDGVGSVGLRRSAKLMRLPAFRAGGVGGGFGCSGSTNIDPDAGVGVGAEICTETDAGGAIAVSRFDKAGDLVLALGHEDICGLVGPEFESTSILRAADEGGLVDGGLTDGGLEESEPVRALCLCLDIGIDIGIVCSAGAGLRMCCRPRELEGLELGPGTGHGSDPLLDALIATGFKIAPTACRGTGVTGAGTASITTAAAGAGAGAGAGAADTARAVKNL